TKLFHAQTSAGHQAAADLFVAHANAPFCPRDVDVGSASQVVDIADLTAGRQRFDSGFKGLAAASGYHYLIHAFPIGHSKNLVLDGSIFIADEVYGSISLRCPYA